MGVLLRLALTFLLLLFGVPALHKLYGYLQDKEHSFDSLPAEVRYAALLEFMFGYLVILLSIGMYLAYFHECASCWPLLLCGVVVGLSWVKMSMLLRRGNPVARRACLILSLFRLCTVFGAVFSVPSALLLASKRSQFFFGRRSRAGMSEEREPSLKR